MPDITIKDIARECGVGVSTVSRALNNHPDINPATKEKIMRVIDELGFVPNNSARNLKRAESNSIALLIKGISNPFFTEMIKVMEERMEDKGYDLVLHHVESKENEIDVALNLVKEKKLQGIIFLGGEFSHSDEKLSLLKVPFVFSTAGLNPNQMSKYGYAYVSIDDLKESGKVVDYLIGMGHRQIAILTAQSEDQSVGNVRLDGYKKALTKAGIPIDERLISKLAAGDETEQYTMENGYRQTKELLACKVPFTALYAISDTLAIGAMRALREAGLSIPEDVSVVGYDGIPLGDFANPRLSTLRQPVEAMAVATIDMLCDIIDGKRTNEQLLFTGELIVRESSSAPR